MRTYRHTRARIGHGGHPESEGRETDLVDHEHGRGAKHVHQHCQHCSRAPCQRSSELVHARGCVRGARLSTASSARSGHLRCCFPAHPGPGGCRPCLQALNLPSPCLVSFWRWTIITTVRAVPNRIPSSQEVQSSEFSFSCRFEVISSRIFLEFNTSSAL